MQNNDLESSISQYLDGNLPPAELSALEARLAEDPDAQAMLAEYRQLDAVLKSVPLPAVRWDELARWISANVQAAHPDQTTRLYRRPLWSSGPRPPADAASDQTSRAYRMPFWIRLAVPLSLAASVLIALGLGIRMFMRHGTPHTDVVVQPPTTEKTTTSRSSGSGTVLAQGSSVIVVGPETEKPAGPVEAEVSVGPSAAAKDEPIGEDVVSRPSSVTIASGVVPVHDAAETLFMDMQ
jgi:negative regulator of sigma E activity